MRIAEIPFFEFVYWGIFWVEPIGVDSVDGEGTGFGIVGSEYMRIWRWRRERAWWWELLLDSLVIGVCAWEVAELRDNMRRRL